MLHRRSTTPWVTSPPNILPLLMTSCCNAPQDVETWQSLDKKLSNLQSCCQHYSTGNSSEWLPLSDCQSHLLLFLSSQKLIKFSLPLFPFFRRLFMSLFLFLIPVKYPLDLHPSRYPTLSPSPLFLSSSVRQTEVTSTISTKMMIPLHTLHPPPPDHTLISLRWI